MVKNASANVRQGDGGTHRFQECRQQQPGGCKKSGIFNESREVRLIFFKEVIRLVLFVSQTVNRIGTSRFNGLKYKCEYGNKHGH